MRVVGVGLQTPEKDGIPDVNRVQTVPPSSSGFYGNQLNLPGVNQRFRPRFVPVVADTVRASAIS